MDDGGAAACTIVLFFALLLIEAILYGFSKAIYLMNEKEIERRAQEENDKKSIALLGIVQHSTIYVNSIQMITTLIDLVMGCFYLPIWINCFTRWLNKLSFLHQISDAGIHIIAVFAATFCLMYVMLTFGTLLPRKLAQKYPDAWAYIFIGHIGRLKTVLYPLTGIVAVSTNALLRVMGLRTTDEQSDVTEEEIISMVNEGHEQGVLLASEAEMIHNIFEFGDKEAKDIMTHRKNICALDGTRTFRQALEFIKENNYSRFPVFLDDIDNIIGVLHIKEALELSLDAAVYDTPVSKIKGLIREVDFIPETRNINSLFAMMQAAKSHLVIVVDEYGQTAGIVAMEDILEEIVLTELYRELMRRGDLIKQRESLEQFQKVELSRLNKELGNYRTQYRSLQTEKDTLYENYAVKQIEAGEYRSRADGIALQMQELSRKIEETELAFSRLTEEYNQPKQDMKEIIRFSQMEKLTQEAVDVFIKKVIIYRDKRVEIEWNYAFGEE